jgi:clan AA aspartic protease (TIGR02281 family)
MRRLLVLAVGIVIGQWLAFAGVESPATVYEQAREAWRRNDYTEAALYWSRAVSLQPDNPYFNYMRGASLARLGHRHAAADALHTTLLLRPSEELARQAASDLATLSSTDVAGPGETVALLENARGVWVTSVVINGHHRGRFLVDTGSSVLVISPEFAKRVGARARVAETLELETIGGRTRGTWTTLDSVKVGEAEVRGSDAVVHSPGGDLDGILGNSFLSRWDASVDPDRRLLRLRRLTTGDEAVSASPR